MRAHFLVCTLTAVSLLAASPVRGQDTLTAAPYGETAPMPGWTFTPAVGVSRMYDDNVLVQGKGADVSSDFLSVFTPQAGLGYNGPRNTLAASYNGAFELYQQFDSLNNYGQFENVLARHKETARTSFFVQQQFSLTPTTEVPLLVGVPFLRLGARIADVKGGVDHAFTKRTSVEATYDFQSIAFDRDPTLGIDLIGGHGHTGSATLRHQISARTTLLTDYMVQHATIIDGTTFTVQNARAGAEHHFSQDFSVFAEAGMASVTTSISGGGHTTPSWNAGASRKYHRISLDASYSRSFVPAFGVGDTMESWDLGGHVRAVVTRRFYTEGSVDRRNDTPLAGEPNIFGDAPLHSVWYSGLAGYVVSPWLRIEGFFTATRQNVDRPGGELDRDRIGIQVTTTKPMRVR